MTALSKVRVGLAVCCFLAASGCATKDKPAESGKTVDVPVSCIAVMPVQPTTDYEGTASEDELKALQDGSRVMDALLKQELAQSRRTLQFVDEARLPSGALSMDDARKVAEQVGCNAVLEVSLGQYTERVGGDYGVKQPAAVTFAYRMYETKEGAVLCHGRFDERQQSLMENLLTLPKAKRRGLTWLTAEELAREGLREKMGQCSYLGGK
ncbi:hypothetical protein Despr_0950 [Desulfobulbus propionicus DSM 2032]|uniref:Lipoprotein n=1 Tax=Desulfobulbus propionicus (strain ATCC 33891 / DSM 2032 / VKM B-1956 / 1pr3) TaxID=577650 RepID=A0A7U4DNL2_DESPD|nr:hypothetical protein [Desulfobulbus propionicus]ADW17124.1 hypothetical protein Despr_0950 [Desulfobulbus propionicus DSM 2032]